MEQVLTDVTLFNSAIVQAVGTPEPRLSGAIARTAKGQFSGAVKGASAIYFAQVTNVAAPTEKFDAKAATQQNGQMLAQRAMQALIPALTTKANVKDNRYMF